VVSDSLVLNSCTLISREHKKGLWVNVAGNIHDEFHKLFVPAKAACKWQILVQ